MGQEHRRSGKIQHRPNLAREVDRRYRIVEQRDGSERNDPAAHRLIMPHLFVGEPTANCTDDQSEQIVVPIWPRQERPYEKSGRRKPDRPVVAKRNEARRRRLRADIRLNMRWPNATSRRDGFSSLAWIGGWQAGLLCRHAICLWRTSQRSRVSDYGTIRLWMAR